MCAFIVWTPLSVNCSDDGNVYLLHETKTKKEKKFSASESAEGKREEARLHVPFALQPLKSPSTRACELAGRQRINNIIYQAEKHITSL